MADRSFDWNDTIENDNSFTLLPEGTYPFTVKSFERAQHPGSEKMPMCNKAVLTLEIDGGTLGTTEITENLFLHSKAEWKLCQFFTAIGQRKHGEAMQMNWNAVTGARGMAKIIINEYTNKNGEKKKNNRVDQYVDPATLPSAPKGEFTPGAF